MTQYEIIRVIRYHKHGARVTAEKTLGTATLDKVRALAERQGADAEEALRELEEMGVTSFRGYMVSEIP